MIETQARVVAVEPGYAWVESERRSGCSHCTSSASCGVSTLSKLFGARRQRLRLADSLGVRTGEDIVIGLSEQRLLAAATVAYLLPLFTMIGAALLSAHLGHGQGVLALSSLLGLGGGLWLVRRHSVNSQAIAGCQPVMLKRRHSGECTIEFKPRNTGVHHE